MVADLEVLLLFILPEGHVYILGLWSIDVVCRVPFVAYSVTNGSGLVYESLQWLGIVTHCFHVTTRQVPRTNESYHIREVYLM
jgi:hypothetical protein